MKIKFCPIIFIFALFIFVSTSFACHKERLNSNVNSSPKSPIDSVPTEILDKIVNLLKTQETIELSLTSQAWKEAVKEAVKFGYEVNLSNQKISGKMFNHLFLTGGIFSDVKKLNLSGSNLNPDLLMNLPNSLERLNLSHLWQPLTLNTIQFLNEKLVHLKRKLRVSLPLYRVYLGKNVNRAFKGIYMNGGNCGIFSVESELEIKEYLDRYHGRGTFIYQLQEEGLRELCSSVEQMFEAIRVKEFPWLSATFQAKSFFVYLDSEAEVNESPDRIEIRHDSVVMTYSGQQREAILEVKEKLLEDYEVKWKLEI